MASNPKNTSKNRKTIKKPYISKLLLDGNEIEIIITDAIYAEILDELMLLNKVAMDFKIDKLSEKLKTKLFEDEQIPEKISISFEDLDKMSVEEILSRSKKRSTEQDPIYENSKEPIKQDLIFQDETSLKDEASLNNETSLNHKISNKENVANHAQKLENENSNNYTSNDESSAPNQKSKNNDENGCKKESSAEDTISKASEKDDFLKIYKPKYSFNDVYVDPDYKRRIISALILAKQRDKLYYQWGLIKTLKKPRPLVLNFYGPPGTGKSMMAEAIASYLDKSVFLVNYSELESGGSGETAKNIVKCFERAGEENAVLIFDEADSFLGKRLTSVSSAADYAINVTRSVMLIELEKFQGVIIFTTNFISNYDIAFKRRILASIEFKLPDEKGRAHIWRTHMPDELPLSPGITPMALAYKYGGTTGADIKDIVLFAAVNCLEKERERLSWEDFDEAYQAVKNRYAVV